MCEWVCVSEYVCAWVGEWLYVCEKNVIIIICVSACVNCIRMICVNTYFLSQCSLLRDLM